MAERESDPLAAEAADGPSEGDTKATPRWLESLSLLRIGNVRYLVATGGLNVGAFQARNMAQAWLVLLLTDSDAWVGIITGVPAIPVIVLAMFGGALVDRMDRRRILIWTRLAMSGLGLLTALLIIADLITVWHLLAIAFPFALLQVFNLTAHNTLMAEVVSRDRLFSMNALGGATINLARFGGPALGGVLIASFGVEWSFFLMAMLFLAAALPVYGIRMDRPLPPSQQKSIMRDMGDGFRYVWQEPALRWLILMSTGVLFAAMYFPIVPRLAKDVLHVGADGYGLILGAEGAGGVLGAVVIITMGNVRSLGRLLVGAAAGFATVIVVFALSTSLMLSATMSFVLGFIIVWWGNSLRTAFQHAAAERMRGRVMGIFSLISQMVALGWLGGGLLSELIGPQAALIAGATTTALIYAMAFLSSPEIRRLGHT